MKAQFRRSEQYSNREAGRAAVQSHERRRQLEVDLVRARDHHRVLELVAVLEELPEAPRSVVELFGSQLLVRVQRLEDGEADFTVVELGRKRHGKRLFGRSTRRLDPQVVASRLWRPALQASASS